MCVERDKIWFLRYEQKFLISKHENCRSLKLTAGHYAIWVECNFVDCVISYTHFRQESSRRHSSNTIVKQRDTPVLIIGSRQEMAIGRLFRRTRTKPYRIELLLFKSQNVCEDVLRMKITHADTVQIK